MDDRSKPRNLMDNALLRFSILGNGDENKDCSIYHTTIERIA